MFDLRLVHLKNMQGLSIIRKLSSVNNQEVKKTNVPK